MKQLTFEKLYKEAQESQSKSNNHYDSTEIVLVPIILEKLNNRVCGIVNVNTGIIFDNENRKEDKINE